MGRDSTFDRWRSILATLFLKSAALCTPRHQPQ
jgi:hypothetical protein